MEKCSICQLECANRKGLSYHISIKHKMKFDMYVVKYELNDVHPICKCGCGAPTRFLCGKFMDYVGHHFHVGRPKSEDHRQKLREVNLGKKVSEETKRRTSESLKKHHKEHPEHGKKFSDIMKGKIFSEEHRRKISETRSARIADGSIVINREKISQTVTQLYLDGGFEWAQGTYISTKTGQVCNYRSSYELQTMQLFDALVNITSWKFEPFFVKYKLDGKMKRYIPDFTYELNDGSIYLLELKPESDSLRSTPMNTAKQKAALKYCQKHNIIYELFSFSELFKKFDTSSVQLLKSS